MEHIKRSLRVLGGLAVVLGISSVLGSNNVRSEALNGFGSAATGGLGGEIVQVRSTEALNHELCRSYSFGQCNDNSPREIQVIGTIDFTGTEGRGEGQGCQYGRACSAPYKRESLLLLDGNDAHCDGKEKTLVGFDRAGKRPLEIGSNKTVIGVGPSATIKGKGLRLNGVSNVVIRNLTISDVNQGVIFAGDAIAIARADLVWIDHNRFHNIGRQMIAGGFGPTTNITISWNDFDGSDTYSSYCNGEHYWNLLFLGVPQTITIANNYFHEISGRAPHIDGAHAVIHLVNNYFHNTNAQQSGGFFHAVDAGSSVQALVEGNYFDNIETPIKTGSGHIFGLLGKASGAMQNICLTVLGRRCIENIAIPVPRFNGFRLDETVVQSFGDLPSSSIPLPFRADDVPAVIAARAGPGHLGSR
ncbi:right-handed parallel beta-helix repeat-containing protein [Bradyrhizobium sp. i1.15.2]|uniref:pectate lyase family protein n=1 Tax=Bradyrhizobium sp. i1.15.2 TaxID=3156362 RepID=UPI003397CF2A